MICDELLPSLGPEASLCCVGCLFTSAMLSCQGVAGWLRLGPTTALDPEAHLWCGFYFFTNPMLPCRGGRGPVAPGAGNCPPLTAAGAVAGAAFLCFMGLNVVERFFRTLLNCFLTARHMYTCSDCFLCRFVWVCLLLKTNTNVRVS